MHLSPDREGLLDQVITHFTPLSVKVAASGMCVEPGSVYEMPENSLMTIDGWFLILWAPSLIARERNPIGIFFTSLAQDYGENAVGIILSGGDGDGTLGIRALKQLGGLTIAQTSNGKSPANSHMPQSAIASGLIDIPSPAENMGQHLAALGQNIEPLGEGVSQISVTKNLDVQNTISIFLCIQTGHDFSGYKKEIFFRRVERRMQINQIELMQDYLEFLEANPDEVTALFRDLLINVTSFFRDEEPFKALKVNIILKLFEERNSDDPVRIRVPACSTGEEVYSIAILMREYLDRLPTTPIVQIFASDIDD